MNLGNIIKGCTKDYSDKRKTFVDPKEKSGSNYKVENFDETSYSMVEVDDCVFNSDLTKCDYAMICEKEKNKIVHFVELKGSDNNKGLNQIYETIYNTKQYFIGYKIKTRLIVTKAEAPRNLDQNLILKIARVTGDVMNGKSKNFIKTNNTFTETI